MNKENLNLKKGDLIRIENNSILSDCMGIQVATGTVFLIFPNNKGFSFKCDQTGAMERCDFDDGNITKEIV